MVVKEQMLLFSPFQSAVAKANKFQVQSVKTHDPDIEFMYSESVCCHAWSDTLSAVATPSAELGSCLKDGNMKLQVDDAYVVTN